MAKLRIASAEEIGFDQIEAFLATHWSRQVALVDEAFYDWQMRRSPLAGGSDHSLIVLDENDGLCGYYGVTPRRLFDRHGIEHRAAELTTLIFAEHVRGSICVWQIIRRLQQDYAALFGMNTTSEAALTTFRRGGFHHIRCIERMVRVYDPDPFADTVDYTPAGRNLLSLQQNRAAQCPAFDEVGKEELSSLLDGYRIPGVNHLSRSFPDVQWRYLDHPYYRHDVFLLEPHRPERRTIIVVRREQHPAFTIGHILEILPLGDQMADVPAFADAYAGRYGVAMLDANFTLSRIAAMFWEAGWLSTLNDHECWMPNVFNPVELRRPPACNMTHWSRIPGESLLDLGTLYVGKGDADLDRPTMYAIERNKTGTWAGWK